MVAQTTLTAICSAIVVDDETPAAQPSTGEISAALSVWVLVHAVCIPWCQRVRVRFLQLSLQVRFLQKMEISQLYTSSR